MELQKKLATASVEFKRVADSFTSSMMGKSFKPLSDAMLKYISTSNHCLHELEIKLAQREKELAALKSNLIAMNKEGD